MSIADQTEDELAQSLLRSAETDAAPAEASDRAYAQFVAAAGLLATGAGVGAAAGTGALGGLAGKATVATTQLAFGLKCVLVGVLAGSAATYAWLGGNRHAPRVEIPASAMLASASALAPSAPASVVQGFPATPQAPPPVGSATPGEPSKTVAVRELAPVGAGRHVPALGPSGPTDAGLASPSSSSGSTDARSLAAEVEALDTARAALGRSPDEALALLARYRRAFPRGKLGPEAEVLRVEAFAARGDRTRAKAAADAFLRAHPTAPQRGRILDLTEPAAGDAKAP